MNDSNYEVAAAYSQIRLRPEFYYRKEQGAKGKFRFRARINLPSLGRWNTSFTAGLKFKDFAFFCFKVSLQGYRG